MSEFELGLSIGVLASQGVFTGHKDNPALQVRVHRHDVQLLDVLKRSLGGRVFGPYAHEGRHSYVYMLRGAALRDALPTLDRLLPDSWRRVQFEAWRARFDDYLDRPRPSPALIDRMQRFLPSGHR